MKRVIIVTIVSAALCSLIYFGLVDFRTAVITLLISIIYNQFYKS